MSVYWLASYMNHSCVPIANMAALAPQISGAATFVATRDIEAGEELTWCYNHDTNMLQHHYGFKCTCAACVTRITAT